MPLAKSDIYLKREKMLELLRKTGSSAADEKSFTELENSGMPREPDGSFSLKKTLAWLIKVDNEKRER